MTFRFTRVKWFLAHLLFVVVTFARVDIVCALQITGITRKCNLWRKASSAILLWNGQISAIKIMRSWPGNVSALQTLYEENPLLSGVFLSQRPVMRKFDFCCCRYCLYHEKVFPKTVELLVIRDAVIVIWRHWTDNRRRTVDKSRSEPICFVYWWSGAPFYNMR